MSDADLQINRNILVPTPATVVATSSSSQALYIVRKSSNDEPKTKVPYDETYLRTWNWTQKQELSLGFSNFTGPVDYAQFGSISDLFSDLDLESEPADWATIIKWADTLERLRPDDLHSKNSVLYRSVLPTFLSQMATSLGSDLKDVIIILDLPAGVVVGYDTKSLALTESQKVQGLKDLPEGVHFLWAGSGYNSSRSGFWLITPHDGSLRHNNVIVKKWDVGREGLISEEIVTEPSTTKSVINESIDKLHPYDAIPVGDHASSNISSKHPTIWQDLTSCIKGSILSKITGTSVWNNWHVSTTDEDTQSHDSQSVFSVTNGETLDFVFPKKVQTFSPSAIGRERTNQAMDTTTHITSIIKNECQEDSDIVIGELQFCYITGMILGNVWCLEHWAHIVKMVFRAIQLTLDDPKFFQKFIGAIQAQLTYDGVGIDGSIFDHDNELAEALRIILTKFKAQVEELYHSTQKSQELTDDQEAFTETFKRFEEFLSKFGGGWNIEPNYLRSGQYQMEDGEYVDAELTEFRAEDERGEFAPAIVELDEDGHETGMVRF